MSEPPDARQAADRAGATAREAGAAVDVAMDAARVAHEVLEIHAASVETAQAALAAHRTSVEAADDNTSLAVDRSEVTLKAWAAAEVTALERAGEDPEPG